MENDIASKKNLIEQKQQKSLEYWALHLKKWQESKLTQSAYCEQAGITYHTFSYWLGKLRSKPKLTDKKKFVPIKVQANKFNISESEKYIQIKLLTGKIICIPMPDDIKEVARLIHLLEENHA